MILLPYYDYYHYYHIRRINESQVLMPMMLHANNLLFVCLSLRLRSIIRRDLVA